MLEGHRLIATYYWNVEQRASTVVFYIKNYKHVNRKSNALVVFVIVLLVSFQSSLCYSEMGWSLPDSKFKV